MVRGKVGITAGVGLVVGTRYKLRRFCGLISLRPANSSSSDHRPDTEA